MGKKLVVVESPAKAKTINNYLGTDYVVMASFGHVRDLPSSVIGVDLENNFEPKYISNPKSKKVISDLKKYSAKADEIFLATDLDREGEAIAWHVFEALKLKKEKTKRITFSEITKDSIKEAVANPREIDMKLVDAQQARRVLDRLVGYNLSPLLWQKVMKGLSAGRVQSVALRLVVEREREIQKFKAEEYWTVDAVFEKDKIKFNAKLVEEDGKKIDKLYIKDEKQAKEIAKKLESGTYSVLSIESKDEKRNPLAPYITSTLQQDAANQLGYSAKQTMRLAQGLYEDGHITYMRTDSVNLSAQAVSAMRKYIEGEFGKNYINESPRSFSSSAKKAQEAHEAIRPTHIENSPEKLNLEARQAKIYSLIWRRALASQMSQAIMETVEARIKNDIYMFSARGQLIKFDGWLKLYPKKVTEMSLPNLEKDEKVNLEDLQTNQHFTEPPARYSEASLIKALEEKGIGRPSTYAPTMSTIQDRGYVVKEKGRLMPEQVGFVVNDLLVENFPDIVDYNFTAAVEDEFDQIAEGKVEWQKMIKEFYEPFAKNLLEKKGTIVKTSMDEKLDEKCPDCGKGLVLKHSRNGKFIGCSGFPDCRYTRSYVSEKQQKELDEAEEQVKGRKCPECKSDLKIARGKYGPFIGCSGYPKCKYMERIAKKKEQNE